MSFTSKQEIIDTMENFEGLYDIIRIVDPVCRNVISNAKDDEVKHAAHCYDFWKRGIPCENCVSYRALSENNTFVKVEFKKDTIYLITSSPVKIKDEKYVMEMIKDVTKSGIVPNINEKSIVEIEETIENLNKKVITDELTNVYNRRYLNERLPVDMNFAVNNNTKLSIVMLDLDYFKQINDVYSHIAGDIILKEISKILKSSIRKDFDWVARYGGDEFLISLPGADNAVARKIAECIREKIENKEIEYQDKKFKITASIGVYTMNSENLSLEELIKRADKNMYQAKIKGRNTVV